MFARFTRITGLLLGILLTQPALGQVDSLIADTTHTYYIEPITIFGQQLRFGQAESPIDKGDLYAAIRRGGVGVIRRGVGIAGDIYLDGFKRGDVEVVIDGERYPNACPNRMDPPTMRANPLDLEFVRVDRGASTLQSGIGGKISYHRSSPSSAWMVRGSLSTIQGNDEGLQSAIAIEGRRHRITAQFSGGNPYLNASGKSFTDLYGYRKSTTYQLLEVSVQGEQGEFEYGAFASSTDDVPFPYLQMDERYNRVFGGFLTFRGNKLYANRTSHLMDNLLRQSASSMTMSSDATNLTIGLSGNWYELYVRRWDIWNDMTPAKPGIWTAYSQRQIPDVQVSSASVYRAYSPGQFDLSARIGIMQVRTGDTERIGFYRTQYPEADRARMFIPAAFTMMYRWRLGPSFSSGIQLELATDAPTAEHLYISVRKPMGKPYWLGNPNLKQPVRLGTRLAIAREGAVSLDLYASEVLNYVYLTSETRDKIGYVTYDNVDAFLAGATLTGEWDLASVRGAYTWAQNHKTGEPLADIAPFTGAIELHTPRWNRMVGTFAAEGGAAQFRVDEQLGERHTPAWYRIDAGVSYQFRMLRLSMEMRNITNQLYYEHLSYMRDPFASGARVFEPGRALRLSLQFNSAQ